MVTEANEQPSVPYKDRRSWLIAFGVVEILLAGLCLLMVAAVMFSFLVLPAASPRQPGSIPPAAVMVFAAVLYGGLAGVFLAVGVGSIRCKNWARLLMLIVSGTWLGIGLLSSLFVLLVFPSLMPQQRGIPPESRHIVLVLMTVIMSLFMVVLPTVFLVFYSRKSVKFTCLSRGTGGIPASSAMELRANKLPAPLIVLAIWQGLGVFAMFGFLMLRATVVFGVVLHGLWAFLILFAYSVLSGYAAWAIFRRRVVGWAIALCTSVFWVISGVVTFATRDLMQVYREIGLREQDLQAFQQIPRFHEIVWVGSIVMMTALLALVLYTKQYFRPVDTEAHPDSLGS